MSLTKKNIADLLAEQVGISQTQALSISAILFCPVSMFSHA
jgi:hypothetical protein